MSLIDAWARAFALTLAVEVAVAVPLIGRREPLGRRLEAVALAQLLSHPAVWFVFPLLELRRLPFLVLVEAWAIGVELLLYRLTFVTVPWTRALAVSALANGASFACGILFQ
ncbi:MAG TPA: hypothetical protein VIU64_13055 [Polyangia bacterium]